MEKMLQRLKQEALWVHMAREVNEYCNKCVVCQQAKLPNPTPAPITNIPIGRPWKMIAVDVLEVPRSVHNNIYLLVIQDYFTTWVKVIPLPDQTARRITTEIVRLFAVYGIPDILHSDQGTNFESTIIWNQQTLYHSLPPPPQCDGMVELMNRLLLQLLRAYVEKDYEWEHYLPHWYSMPTVLQYTLQQESHHLYSCLEGRQEVRIYHLLLHLTQTHIKATCKQS